MSADTAIRRGGFTLIEVLVALAIVALGLVGVFGQVSQSATAASRLRDKTLASWVALNRLTELRMQGAFPRVGTSSGDEEMANTRWHWQMTVSEADGKIFRRAEVAVSLADTPERPLAVVSGFLMQQSDSNVQVRPTWVSASPAGGPGQQPPPAPGASPSPNPVPPPPTEPDQSEQ